MATFEKEHLTAIISELEQQWLKPLLHFVEGLFAGFNLPSHDQEHHYRVWIFAKELLFSYSNKTQTNFSKEFIECLLISCFMHDIGLTQTPGEEHGEQSAELARSFLKDSLAGNMHSEEMFKAIILHDDKSYSRTDNNTIPGIYHFLTVADDLDALGALGLIRYLEIYAHRNISVEELQERIRLNLDSRFKFIEQFVSFDKTLLQKHDDRYRKAQEFLRQLDTQVLAELIKRIHQSDLVPRTNEDSLIEDLMLEYSHELKLI